LLFLSLKVPVCCFNYKVAGAKLKYKLAIAANFSFKSQKNEHYSPTGGKIMVPVAAILSSHRHFGVLRNISPTASIDTRAPNWAIALTMQPNCFKYHQITSRAVFRRLV
jgi:hypothetical protein